MGDLKDPRLMYLKAGLFLLAGCAAVTGILVEFPSVRLAALLVIEHYMDPGYKFAGLGSFLLYLLRQKKREKNTVN